jgi:hypothetical protein
MNRVVTMRGFLIATLTAMAWTSAAVAQDAPVTTAPPAPASANTAEAPVMNCSTGPLEKTYGGEPWLVVGCDDGKTLTFVAANGNPSAPFVIKMTPKDDSYALTGDGTGDATAAKAAFAEIQALSEGEVEVLFEEVREAGVKADAAKKQ